MKAANLLGPKNLSYEEVPDPICPNGGVIVKVHACGICGSDLRTYEGGSSYAKFPAILGHEITGEIHESNHPSFQVGQILAVAPVTPCNHCYYCKRGMQNLCSNLEMIGIASGVQGGFAQYLSLTKDNLEKGSVVVLPKGVDNIPTVIAEPASSCLSCQENANVSLGDQVMIIGAGTLGTLNGLIAKLRGAKDVIMVEPNSDKVKMAKTLGFDTFIEEFSSHQSVNDYVMEITKGRGMDVVITACPSPMAQADALGLTRKRGKVIFFGGVSKDAKPELDTNIIHYREVTILGANAYAPRHFKMAVNIILEEKIDASRFITKRYPLNLIEQGFKDMKKGVLLKGIYDYSLNQ
jgi:L-iditol 2-dehydrogenase